MAKGLAFATGKPLLPVNHLEGHIYSNWVEAPAPRLLATSSLWWC
jgi:N6-L-threonylcarbamoyladenine synthase